MYKFCQFIFQKYELRVGVAIYFRQTSEIRNTDATSHEEIRFNLMFKPEIGVISNGM